MTDVLCGPIAARLVRTALPVLCIMFAVPVTPAERVKLPIIDMHLHAHGLDEYGGGGTVCTSDQRIVFPGIDPRSGITIEKALDCPKPLRAAASDDYLV